MKSIVILACCFLLLALPLFIFVCHLATVLLAAVWCRFGCYVTIHGLPVGFRGTAGLLGLLSLGVDGGGDGFSVGAGGLLFGAILTAGDSC